jgi:uncharacterized protein (TIGR02996 family)
VATTDAQEQGFLQALQEKPDDAASRLAYADWLEEHGRPLNALEQRAKAGVSEAQYKVRRKSDGLFSEGGERRVVWSAKGKAWLHLVAVRAHLTAHRYKTAYADSVPWSDVEVVVIELRPQQVATFPVLVENSGARWRQRIHIGEPTEGAKRQAEVFH